MPSYHSVPGHISPPRLLYSINVACTSHSGNTAVNREDSFVPLQLTGITVKKKKKPVILRQDRNLDIILPLSGYQRMY